MKTEIMRPHFVLKALNWVETQLGEQILRNLIKNLSRYEKQTAARCALYEKHKNCFIIFIKLRILFTCIIRIIIK